MLFVEQTQNKLMDNKTIIIAGATGYIGRYLAVDLHRKGINVLALGRNPKVMNFFKEQGVQTLEFDVLNDNDYCQLPVNNIQAIINLAVALPEHEVPMERFYEINVVGNYKLLEFAKKNRIQRFVMASSHKVYYDIYNTIITEDMLPCFKGPHSPYIISKITAEQWMQYYGKDFGLDTITLRLTGVHGYGSLMGFLHKDGSYTRGGCEWIMEHAIKGEPIEVWGNTEILRDHVYIKDVVSAFEAAAYASEGTKGIYNVSSGVGHTLLEEAEVIADVFASTSGRSPIVCCPEKPGVQRGYLYSIDKIKREIGWTPVYTDLHMMYEDYKKEWKAQTFHNYHYIKPEDKPITF